MKVLKDDQKKGITAQLLEWDREKVFLPRNLPNFGYFFSTDEWKFVQEDANVTPPWKLPVFMLTPPADSQFSEVRVLSLKKRPSQAHRFRKNATPFGWWRFVEAFGRQAGFGDLPIRAL